MNRLQRLGLVIGATVLVAAVASCSQDGTGDGPDTTATASVDQVTVVATEFGFDPADIEVPAGTPFELTLDNKGVVEHDLTIEALDVAIHAPPGQAVTETVTIPAGTYDIHCTVPGHHESGMVGTLTAS